jgi:hypothetical protein
MPRPAFIRLVAILSFTLCTAINASAQEGVYVQGTFFGDIRQFGTAGFRAVLPEDNLSIDATGFGGSARVGTWIDERWTLEAGYDLANRTNVEFENPYILAIFPPGVVPRDLSASTSFTSVTTTIGFHQRLNRQWRFGYRAGFSFVRATYRSEFPFAIALPTLSGSSSAVVTLLQQSRLPFDTTGAELVQKQNTGALALGVEAAFTVRENLAIVPELRALTFSTLSRGTFLIRPGVGVRWSFDD